jgi:paraquat-inducible protein B
MTQPNPPAVDVAAVRARLEDDAVAHDIAADHLPADFAKTYAESAALMREAAAALDQQQRALAECEAENLEYRKQCDQQQREIERLKAQHETDELVAQVHREEGVEARRVIMDRDVEIVQLRADLAAAQAIAEADVYRKAHKEERQRCEQAEQERDRLRDILTRRQNYAGDDRFGETR